MMEDKLMWAIEWIMDNGVPEYQRGVIIELVRVVYCQGVNDGMYQLLRSPTTEEKPNV